MVRKQFLSTVAVAATLVVVAPLAASAEPAPAAGSRAGAPAAQRADQGGGGLKDVDNRLGSVAYRPSAAQKQALKRLGEIGRAHV